jgi:hypothetical protein
MRPRSSRAGSPRRKITTGDHLTENIHHRLEEVLALLSVVAGGRKPHQSISLLLHAQRRILDKDLCPLRICQRESRGHLLHSINGAILPWRCGATLNFGRRVIRATVGLPGTGLSWSERIKPGRGRRGAPIIGWLIAIVAVVAIVIALGR